MLLCLVNLLYQIISYHGLLKIYKQICQTKGRYLPSFTQSSLGQARAELPCWAEHSSARYRWATGSVPDKDHPRNLPRRRARPVGNVTKMREKNTWHGLNHGKSLKNSWKNHGIPWKIVENHGRWRNQWLKMSWNILGWHRVSLKTGSTKVAHWASDLPRIVPVGWGFCLVETTNGRLSLLDITW